MILNNKYIKISCGFSKCVNKSYSSVYENESNIDIEEPMVSYFQFLYEPLWIDYEETWTEISAKI